VLLARIVALASHIVAGLVCSFQWSVIPFRTFRHVWIKQFYQFDRFAGFIGNRSGSVTYSFQFSTNSCRICIRLERLRGQILPLAVPTRPVNLSSSATCAITSEISCAKLSSELVFGQVSSLAFTQVLVSTPASKAFFLSLPLRVSKGFKEKGREVFLVGAVDKEVGEDKPVYLFALDK